MNDLISGVEYMHIRGVIHRDLKTSNLLIKTNGTLAICDMGSAVISNRYVSYSVVGTEQYIDVSVLSSTYERIYTKECDWWSVGCILAEITTGMSPILPIWETHTLDQKMEWRLRGERLLNEYQPLLDQITDVVYKSNPFGVIKNVDSSGIDPKDVDSNRIYKEVLRCFRLC